MAATLAKGVERKVPGRIFHFWIICLGRVRRKMSGCALRTNPHIKGFYLVLKNDEIIVSRNILNSVVEVSP